MSATTPARKEAVRLGVDAREALQYCNYITRPPGGANGQPMTDEEWARIALHARRAETTARRLCELAIAERERLMAEVAP